jgi:phosphoglycerate-specific signal transduction histidine kinase
VHQKIPAFQNHRTQQYSPARSREDSFPTNQRQDKESLAQHQQKIKVMLQDVLSENIDLASHLKLKSEKYHNLHDHVGTEVELLVVALADRKAYFQGCISELIDQTTALDPDLSDIAEAYMTVEKKIQQNDVSLSMCGDEHMGAAYLATKCLQQETEIDLLSLMNKSRSVRDKIRMHEANIVANNLAAQSLNLPAYLISSKVSDLLGDMNRMKPPTKEREDLTNTFSSAGK